MNNVASCVKCMCNKCVRTCQEVCNQCNKEVVKCEKFKGMR